MIGYRLPLSRPVIYHYTGKFQAPSEEWKHEKMPLGDYELIVMTEGSLHLAYGDRRYTVEEKEYLLLPPMTPPACRIGTKPSACSFYWLHFAVDGEPDLIDLAGPCVGLAGEQEGKSVILPESGRLKWPDKLLVLMKQLQDFIRSDYGSLSADYMSTTVLCELYNQTFKEKLDNMKCNYSKKQLYYDIVDYINENIHKNLRVADIAAAFGYNEKYLSHAFAGITGFSLKQYILQKKAAAANYLLADTNKTVEEIAGLLGFADPHNFMRTYKKVTGLTPTEYRNAYFKRMLFHV